MNSKGILLKETLGVILAVVLIGVLVFGVWRVFWQVTSSDAEEAQKILDSIVAKVQALEDGKSSKLVIRGMEGSGEVDHLNPGDWYLYAWGSDEPGAPDQCLFESCICVCELKERWEYGESCGEGSLCSNVVEKEWEIESNIYADRFYVEGGIVNRDYMGLWKVNYVKLPSSLIDFDAVKDAESVKIVRYSSSFLENGGIREDAGE